MSNRSGTLTFNENMERSNYKGTLMDLTVDFKKTKTTRPSNRDPTTLMAYKLITELNSMLTRHLPNNLMGSISHAEDKYREKKVAIIGPNLTSIHIPQPIFTPIKGATYLDSSP